MIRNALKRSAKPLRFRQRIPEPTAGMIPNRGGMERRLDVRKHLAFIDRMLQQGELSQITAKRARKVWMFADRAVHTKNVSALPKDLQAASQSLFFGCSEADRTGVKHFLRQELPVPAAVVLDPATINYYWEAGVHQLYVEIPETGFCSWTYRNRQTNASWGVELSVLARPSGRVLTSLLRIAYASN